MFGNPRFAHHGNRWARGGFSTDRAMEVRVMLSYFWKIKARDDEGASAVEYGLLVAAIAAIIILVVFALGTYVKGAFKDTCTAFNTSKAVNVAGNASSDCTK
jgi:pilus assembly protein Flp/PilA